MDCITANEPVPFTVKFPSIKVLPLTSKLDAVTSPTTF